MANIKEKLIELRSLLGHVQTAGLSPQLIASQGIVKDLLEHVEKLEADTRSSMETEFKTKLKKETNKLEKKYKAEFKKQLRKALKEQKQEDDTN